ncbi:MAG: NAD-dependent protein deacetylase [Chromatiales bacterium]|jgi:NAD-dependent SIR2 family protein deacetylase|nr:NAD-dependent protein deacetylase [Chromatiales bacterium]
MDSQEDLERFTQLAKRHRPWFVLTGAGCSTGSGIPDYRDVDGQWKRKQPIHFPQFMATDAARRRYWARSMVGWTYFSKASPNAIHASLARLESSGAIHQLVTQNVDGLHQHAGSSRIIDLHGRLDQVICTQCGLRSCREQLQARLELSNPEWLYRAAQIAPDGDVDLEGVDYDRFRTVECEGCGGILKPDVVFFGENVPKLRVGAAMASLAEAGALMVVGSSLMVFSGYRFVRAAVADGQPILIANRGKTRGDDDATCKVELSAENVLAHLESAL